MSEKSNATTISTVSASSLTWLQKHERLVIVFMSLLLAYFVVDKGFSLASSYESHKAQQAATTLGIQASKDAADLAQAKAQLVNYQNALAVSTQQNASLTAAIASRNKTVVVQEQKDAALPPSQLATRWQGLVNNTGIQTAANGYAVTDDAALATVDQLEQVPVLAQNLKDETTTAANLQKDVTDANTLINSGKLVVNGLQLQIQDQDKSCTASINALKAKDNKSKLKWFGIGYVSGFISGLLVK
jgi:hypothetical protein